MNIDHSFESLVTAIVPTLNEGASIYRLLEKLSELYPDLNVLVVDDNSSDDTQDKVREFAKKIGKEKQYQLLERIDVKVRGITASVLDGLARIESEYFFVMDGDLQHPPEAVAKMLAELEAGNDIVVGERSPYVERQGLHRVLITWTATQLAKFYLKLRDFRLLDPMAGFFGAKFSSIEVALEESNRSRFEPEGYKVLFDLLRIVPKDLKLSSFSYDFTLRSGGESKLRPVHAWFFLRSMFK